MSERFEITTTGNPYTILAGNPATTASDSMLHSFVPRRILKKPLSPHSAFQEFATVQYLTPSATPYPRILTLCPPSGFAPALFWYTPLLYVRKSSYTVYLRVRALGRARGREYAETEGRVVVVGIPARRRQSFEYAEREGRP